MEEVSKMRLYLELNGEIGEGDTVPLKKYVPGGEGSGDGAVGGGIREGETVPLVEYMPGGEGSGDGAVGGGIREGEGEDGAVAGQAR
jgi:hypothetical protein